MNSLSKLQNKYGSTSSPMLLSSWKESPVVVELSEFIKSNKDQGFQLMLYDDGCPGIHFDPPLDPQDAEEKERCDLAEEVSQLLLNATDDLVYLIEHDLITLKLRGSF